MQFVVLLWVLLFGVVSSATEWVSVKWVDDGDTILLTDGRRVRYIGINAPEVAHAKYGQSAEPFGKKAFEANKALVYGKKVRLEFDREAKDHYGRLLAYVYLEDGRCVNFELINAGWAGRGPGSGAARQRGSFFDAEQGVFRQAVPGHAPLHLLRLRDPSHRHVLQHGLRLLYHAVLFSPAGAAVLR